MIRCLVGRERQRDVTHRGREHGAIPRQLLDALSRERLRHVGWFVANGDRVHDDPVDREAGLVHGGLRDLLRDEDPFVDPRKDGVPAVESGLVRHGNEELYTRAIGLAGNLRRRHRASRLLLA